jgi:hypothetical protein
VDAGSVSRFSGFWEEGKPLKRLFFPHRFNTGLKPGANKMKERVKECFENTP